jgi:hypothetical protein
MINLSKKFPDLWIGFEEKGVKSARRKAFLRILS